MRFSYKGIALLAALCGALYGCNEPFEPTIRLAKVNTEAEPHLAAQFGIRSIPTLALFQGGREIARQTGAMGAQDIVRWASAHVGR